VANSLAAIENGARQVECTINGLGERAGNAALEEIVMALHTRHDIYQFETRIDTTQIVPVSRLVSTITGFPVQPNKAIVGANAFAHESGIHQDGVLKSRETYEIMRAQDVGWDNNRLVLGKHSGRSAFRARLNELGIELASEAEFNETFRRFKDLADKKHEIYDDDLQALVTDIESIQGNEWCQLVSLRVCSQSGAMAHAELSLKLDGKTASAQANGAGPVDAAFQAIEQICRSGADLVLYSVNNITNGSDAQGEVTVRLASQGRVVNGQGADIDIVIASVKAYLNALNKMMQPMRANPQRDAI
jgi:2-isopropylmalate synthase